MSAERNMVSLGGAMLAALETSRKGEMYLSRAWEEEVEEVMVDEVQLPR
jgi:hypothetical protein